MLGLAAFCIVVAVGVPLAFAAFMLALELLAVLAKVCWILVCACAIVIASPVLLPLAAYRWLKRKHS